MEQNSSGSCYFSLRHICIPSIASSVEGFDKDIVRWWDGAVGGTEYENATQEIQIQAALAVVEDGKLVIPLIVIFLKWAIRNRISILWGDWLL